MDVWQFTLFFLALVIGYVLVHLRLVRFEEHLQKLGGIRNLDDRLVQIDERLRQLSESFDRLRLDRIESQLGRMHDGLEDLREATLQAHQHAVAIPTAAVPTPPAAERGASPQSRILATIEARLLAMGYHDIDVLTELGDGEPPRELELQIECWRGGMPVKGRVYWRNGSVRDVVMQTVAQMFP
jgi:hypothetical protein